MLFNTTHPSDKRKAFRAGLKSGKLLKFPGAFSALSAMSIEKLGFEGVYISGSVLSNSLGYPDVGLTTLTEVAQAGRQIARVTALPSLIDADTGFGVAMNAARSVQELIEMGLSGCHLEDQENPKRCGHLDGKSLVAPSEMIQKIRAADLSRKMDPNFVIVARTDARAMAACAGFQIRCAESAFVADCLWSGGRRVARAWHRSGQSHRRRSARV